MTEAKPSKSDDRLLRRSEVLPTSDGTTKYVFETRDAYFIEGVRFPANDPEDAPTSLCLSSQVGCAYRCTHCATGLVGFKRNLTGAELVDQAVLMAEGYASTFNLVFEGMGEGFLNLDNILAAMQTLIGRGAVPSTRMVVVGTSGVAKGWHQLAELTERPYIDVSIHGVPDETRMRVVPHTRAYGLAALAQDVHRYQDATGDEVTFNYTPMAAVNDSDEDYRSFANWCADFHCRAKIIPYNPIHQLPHRPAPPDRLENLLNILKERGVPYVLRPSRGRDVFGGCGQLGLLTPMRQKPARKSEA